MQLIMKKRTKIRRLRISQASLKYKLFAANVEQGLKDMIGGTRYIRVWYGIVLQLI